MVPVKYENVKTPVLNIKDAKKNPRRVQLLQSVDATDKGTDIVRVIKGSNTIYGQYHYTLETIVCIVRPTEEGLEVHATTQWTDAIQTMIARALKMDENR